MRTAKNSKLSFPFGVFVLVFCLLNGTAWGQLNVNTANTPFVIDFESTLSGVNNGAFTAPATISTATPGSGQLNRAAWSFQSTTTPATTAADFTMDEANGKGVLPSYAPNSNQGWYSFNTANLNGSGTNRCLGWQPGATIYK